VLGSLKNSLSILNSQLNYREASFNLQIYYLSDVSYAKAIYLF